jgi:hypothetical protein
MKKSQLFFVVVILLMTSSICSAVAAEAENKINPWKKFGFNLGGSFNLNNSRVQLGVNNLGLSIDAEELLGLDTHTTSFMFEAYWRFTKNLRHRFDFEWKSYRRSGNTTLLRDIDVGDHTIPLGSTVDTTFDLDVFRLSYSYSFFQDDRMDLAFAIGAYIVPVNFDLKAQGLVNVVESESITAPLPVVGLRFDFALTPKWFLRNSLDIFYLEIDDFRGGITDVKIRLEYDAFKNVGFGLSAEYFWLLIEGEDTVYPGVDFEGTFEYQNLGILAYVKVYFGE